MVPLKKCTRLGKSFSKKSFIYKLAVTASLCALALPANAVTLNEAVFKALQDNPDVQIRVKEKLANDSRINEARGGFYPTTDLQADFGRQYTENSFTRARVSNNPAATLWRSNASLSLRQMVFDGLETWNLVDEAEDNAKASGYRLVAQAELISLDVTQAYLEVIRRSRVAQLARANVGIHNKYIEMVQSRAQAGVGSLADVSQAESRLGAAETTLLGTLKNLRDSVASYKRLVGVDPHKLIRPDTPLTALPKSLESAIDRALANNPTILAAERDVSASHSLAQSTKASFLPRFDVELEGSRGNDINGIVGTDTDLKALFVMRYNLYNGGADTARQRTAIFERSRVQSALDRVRRLVEEETKFSWHAMMSSRDEVFKIEDVVNANINVRDAYLKQFELGQRSLLDLLDSENELFVSRNDLVNKRFETLFNSYRVLTATGNLLESIDVKMPEHYINLAASAHNDS